MLESTRLDLQAAFNRRFTEPTPPRLNVFRDRIFKSGVVEADLAAPAGAPFAVLDDVGFAAVPEQVPFFSAFEPAHADRATQVSMEFFRISDAAPETELALQAVLGKYDELKTTENPELLDFALALFLTHSQRGRAINIPELLRREPQKTLPSAVAAAGALTLDALPHPEAHPRLVRFREDPVLNDHHAHWHIVYPARGYPRNGKTWYRPRHGEMFFYMHRQMLARYEAERLSAGVEPVPAYGDFGEPVPVGYTPPGLLADEYTDRPAGEAPPDMRPTAEQMIRWRTALLDAFREALQAGGQLSMDQMGDLTEAGGPGRTDTAPTGNYHNSGHGKLSRINAVIGPDGRPTKMGVMSDPAVAIRDPVFWMWHKAVDQVSEECEDLLPEEPFTDLPRVEIRKEWADGGDVPDSPDLFLFRREGVLATEGDLDRRAAIVRSAFAGAVPGEGGAQGEVDGAVHPLATTRSLRTRYRTRIFKLRLNGSEAEVPFEMLDHDAFSYAVRIRNPLSVPQRVTVRVFLAPWEQRENRLAWMEMDKWIEALPAGAEHVAYREDHHSVVIRRPVPDLSLYMHNLDTQDQLSLKLFTQFEPNAYRDALCNCGWPYHLLLPSGTQEAPARYLLMVMCTNADFDQVSPTTECQSMSFCGAKDEYPDRRPMGYPFHRPFPGGLVETLTAQPGTAFLPITIQNEGTVAS